MAITPIPDRSLTAYWDYLQLDKILDAQAPITKAHDEFLFVVIHQAFELWFLLLIRELRETIKCLGAHDVAGGVHYLRRVNTVLRATMGGWEVMDTMTPAAFREFREQLIPASGTQSFQFRELEALAGMTKTRTVQDTKEYYWERTPDAGMTLKFFFEKYGDRLRALEEEVVKTGTLRSTAVRLLLKGTASADLHEAAKNATGDLKTLITEVRAFDEGLLLWRGAHVSTTAHAIQDAPGTVLNDKGNLPTESCVGYLQSTINVQERLLFPEFHQS
jgi:tryptophan 2,3-dioxygenase